MNHPPRHDYDPWEGRTPLLRRPVIRAAITLIAVGSFLLVTLISSCAPRRSRPVSTTTTTVPGIEVVEPSGGRDGALVARGSG